MYIFLKFTIYIPTFDKAYVVKALFILVKLYCVSHFLHDKVYKIQLMINNFINAFYVATLRQ